MGNLACQPFPCLCANLEAWAPACSGHLSTIHKGMLWALGKSSSYLSELLLPRFAARIYKQLQLLNNLYLGPDDLSPDDKCAAFFPSLTQKDFDWGIVDKVNFRKEGLEFEKPVHDAALIFFGGTMGRSERSSEAYYALLKSLENIQADGRR